MSYPNNYYQNEFYPQYQNGAVPDMLNQYKVQYQQPMPQIQQSPQMRNMQMPPISQKPINDIIWVQGLEGAKGFLVAPNNTVVLWDTENPVIYVKTADASGIPSMRVLDFQERNSNISNSQENEPKTHECKCGVRFATKEQFEALKCDFERLTAKVEELTQPVATKTTIKKAKESEE